MRLGFHATACLAGITLSGLSACAPEATRLHAPTLVAALQSDPGHLNPAITTNGNVHTAASLLYNGLVTLHQDLRVTPELARRWDVLDGGARYRFTLRDDVRWHDGRPLTASDVKFTFDSLLLRFHARMRASLGPVLLSVDAPDDSTVDFRLRRPYAPLLQQLDVVEAPILPRHVYEGADPLTHPANLRPVGTGPFRFVDYRADREIRYRANESYFGGAPALRAVTLRIIPDPGMQVAALERGEVDWLFAVPGPERAQLRKNPRIRLQQTSLGAGGSNCITTFGFNLDRPVFRDVRVRRAIAHAVDRYQFLERVAFGEGRVAGAPISSGIPFAHARGLPMPELDTAAAARLLDEAGWIATRAPVRVARGVAGVRDGTPLVVEFTGMSAQTPYGNLLRAQLRPLGVELRVTSLEQAVFSNTIFRARDFDMAVVSYCNGTDPEIGVRRQYVSASIGPVPFSNLAGYRNPEMDTLFDRASAALDPEQRRSIYRRIQEIAIRDLPYIWVLESVQTHAYTTRCGGFGSTAHFAATATCRE